MTPLSRDNAKPSDLPRHAVSSIWVDHEIPEPATATFTAWLDADLERLEGLYRDYWTRSSLTKSLNR